MSDSFSSVENMLQYQIENAYRRVNELESAFKKSGEPYPLPKQTDGLPDSWAFGKLTNHEVSLALAQQGLNFVKSQLKLTETDLSNGDLPSGIYRIINVHNAIASICASWASASSVRVYRYVRKYRQSKSEIARNSRKYKPSKNELTSDREGYFCNKGTYQGWRKYAQSKYKLSPKTLNKILEK